MKYLFSFLCLAFVVNGIAQNSHYTEEITSGYKGGIIKNIKTLEDAVSFAVIGDWGRHGQYYQKEVGEKLGDAIVGIDGSFIISTGDNIYPSGVRSEYDPSWQSAFENVYTHHATHVNWYVALGNHDYKTNPDAEVAYTKISQRWNMPARYFSIKKRIDGDDSTKTIEFFFIDSNPFQSDYYSDEEYGPQVAAQDTAAQKQWLESALAASTATWKFVVGHHPLYSAGKRKGKTNDMISSFDALFNKYKVDAYFAGHEHHLEFDQAPGDSFLHFISGAGSEARPVSGAGYAKFVMSQHGFMTVSVNETAMLVQFINYRGEVMFTRTFTKK